jgi:hypothetical protein
MEKLILVLQIESHRLGGEKMGMAININQNFIMQLKNMDGIILSI